MWVLVNRHLEDNQKTTLPLMNRGLFMGDGVFTTMRARDGKLLLWQDHCARLSRDADLFGLEFKSDGLYEAIHQLLQENNLLSGDARVRVMCTRDFGSYSVGVDATEKNFEIVVAIPYQMPNTAVHLTTSSFVKGPASVLTQTKNLGYQASQFSVQEAKRKGYDDSIFLNYEKKIVCATTSNVYVLADGVWYTPPLEDGALPGIIREHLLTSGQVMEKSFGVEALKQVTAMCLSNSLTGIRPVIRFEDAYFDVSQMSYPQIKFI